MLLVSDPVLLSAVRLAQQVLISKWQFLSALQMTQFIFRSATSIVSLRLGEENNHLINYWVRLWSVLASLLAFKYNHADPNTPTDFDQSASVV